jgi:CRISPR-associated protein Cst1
LSWHETQDLILFRLYEVLHTWLRDKGIEVSTEEEERSELETE